MSNLSDVEAYINNIPAAAQPHFDTLRKIATNLAPQANEVVSYGIIGYKVDEKRARVFISGWHDHVAIYPVPSDEALRTQLQPYIKGKGTLWFSLDQPLPESLIKQAIKSLL
jgi:uncharacterized protein YdhG (YjbR/CyaY superfamily)